MTVRLEEYPAQDVMSPAASRVASASHHSPLTPPGTFGPPDGTREPGSPFHNGQFTGAAKYPDISNSAIKTKRTLTSADAPEVA